MSPRLKTVQLTPDDILTELVVDALPNLLGATHRVIASSLPFEGNHILAVTDGHRPALISYDGRDGGRALLSGLGVLDALAQHRAILHRLYPALFSRGDGTGTIFSVEAVHLVTLSPTPPPGSLYLTRSLPALSVRTFRVLEIDGEIGLLLDTPDPAAETMAPDDPRGTDRPHAAFRARPAALSEEEERYFG